MSRRHAYSLLLALLLAGCGINKSRLATEQLVVSDAVDKSVASIDFSPLSGKKVYFDTQYLDGLNMGPNGNVKYVISSLRQQMIAYDCRLQEKADTAEYIVEGRVGVLANDGHELTYGIPGSAAAASASVLLASPMTIPALPELSLGRRHHQAGTAKIGLFAYDRVTREPVWQAGVKKASSEMRDTWILGLGPYHSRAKAAQRQASKRTNRQALAENVNDPLEAYGGSIVFQRAIRPPQPAAASQPEVATASHSQAAEPKPIAQPAAAASTSTPQPSPK